MTTLSRLKFAALVTACGLLIELGAVALLSPKTLPVIPWLMQAVIGLVFFYVVAPLATMRLRLFNKARE